MSDKLTVRALWSLVPRPVIAFEVALLAGLTFVFRARASTGLLVDGTGVEQMVMLGGFLVVAIHLMWIVGGLASRAEANELGDTTWLFWALPLILYLVILPWSTSRRGLDGDEPHFLLIAHSLAYDLDVELTNNYQQQDSLRFVDRVLEPSWADPVRADGLAFSRHSPLFPLLLVPGYRLAGKHGGLITMALLTAIASWLAYRLAKRYWPGHGSQVVWSWALLSLTPPLLLYSHQLWVEVPAMLMLLVALLQIRTLEETPAPHGRASIVLIAVLILLPALKLRFLLLTASLIALAWWRSGRSRRILLGSGLGLATLAGALLAINRLTTGKWLRDHSFEQLVGIQASQPIEYLRGATGLFWDCAFGLFAANPTWLLLIPALILVARQRPPIAFDLLVLGLPYLAVIAPRAEWYGAWSPPFRFGIVLLPLLAIALVPLLARAGTVGAQTTRSASIAAGALLSLLWLAEPGWTYNLATGTSHLLDHLAMLWSADAARFFPSQVRLRTASWLVPLLIGAAVVVFWWWPRRRAVAPVTGVALLLVALAAVPLAARLAPTRVIEMEDHHLSQRGGELYPEAWAPYRPRFRGGWRLRSGESVAAPIAAGGTSVSVELELLFAKASDGPPSVILQIGDQTLGAQTVEATRGWQTLSFENLEWAGGEPMVFVLESRDFGESANSSVILDRATLTWH